MGYTFKSGFAEELQLYVDMKIASGYSKRSFLQYLKKFDQFCFDRGIDSVCFSRDVPMLGEDRLERKPAQRDMLV